MNSNYRLIAASIVVCLGTSLDAGDWSRFRGPGGQGVVDSSAGLPAAWSPDANLLWKTEMPGPGASSPIIVGNSIFVTCYSGYGLTQEDPGNIEDLVRHLVKIDAQTGKIEWQKDVKVSLPEDPYTGIGVTAHGYASHTPVTDGKNVYAFFGKSGVHAFDMSGRKLWQADVGKESDPAKWGSSSSPIVFGNIVIVTAAAESQAIIGLDSPTGKEIWRQEAKGLDNMWGTPTLVQMSASETELVMCVAGELWGMEPTTGKLKWFAKATGAEQSYASVVTEGKRVFAMTGRGGGSVAIDAGGSGDITETNTVWEGRDTASFASPVADESKLYSIARGVMTVVDKKTGERVTQVRLRGAQQTGGRFGSLDYASPIVVGNRLFYLNGSGQMFVFDLNDNAKQIAVNKVTSDKETFWGTPAVSDGKLILRSSKYLYCVSDKGETVSPNETVIAAAEPVNEPTGRVLLAADDPDQDVLVAEPGGGRDPMSMFNDMDTNKDGKVTESELQGNRFADRLKTLDKDGDKAISSEEFRTGAASLFQRSGGGGSYGRRGSDNRPDRPQRPEMAGK